jgi:hypothetical protein
MNINGDIPASLIDEFDAASIDVFALKRVNYLEKFVQTPT